MADDAPNGGHPEIPQPVMTITLDPHTGNVNVSGPVANKVLCYGMLELAKDAIRRYNPNRIVEPAGILPPEFRRQ